MNKMMQNDVCPFCDKPLGQEVSIRQHMEQSTQCYIKAVKAIKGSGIEDKPVKPRKIWQPPVS
jgi:hypothetical protein